MSLKAWRRTLVVLGLAISALMVSRAQVGGDQLDLLARGWRLAARGTLVPHGNPLSNGGNEPGALTSLLIGAPLYVWMDHRAPAVTIWFAHLFAYLLLDRLLRRTVGERERLLFVLFYWLNPWQLYFAGFVWNPNYLFLLGAVHMVTAHAQRERARFGASFWHAFALGLAAQLHPSFFVLVFASLWLLWRRAFRLHWTGAILGGVLASLTLIPWAIAAAADPSILPGGKGFPFWGLVKVYPLFRGLVFWIRYSSSLVAARMEAPDFTTLVGVGGNAVLAPLTDAVRSVLGGAGYLLALVAGWRFMRGANRNSALASFKENVRGMLGGAGLRPAFVAARRFVRRQVRRARPLDPLSGGRAWLRAYAGAAFVGALLAFAVSPTTVMWWQGLIAVHAAVLPSVLAASALLRWRRSARWAARLAPWWAVASVVVLFAMALSSPHYRCNGPETLNLAMRSDHPMFHELGIQQRCPFPIDPRHGWWPDALPPEPMASPALPQSPAPTSQ